MDEIQNQKQEASKALLTYEEFHEAMGLVATKDDLKNFATKDDFFGLERRIGNIEANMETNKDSIMNMLDKISKDFNDWRIENMAHAQTHREINDELKDHKERIINIENAPAGLS